MLRMYTVTSTKPNTDALSFLPTTFFACFYKAFRKRTLHFWSMQLRENVDAVEIERKIESPEIA
jgi:glutaredoxin